MRLSNIANFRRKIYLFSRDDKGILEIKTDDTFYPFYFEKDVNGDYISYDGVPLKKVVVPNPSDINKQRSSESYSSDIKFVNNYLLHKVDKIESSIIKYLFLDIEVLSPKEFPEPSVAKYPVSCITIYNSETKDYITWYLPDYKDEKSMLEDFCFYVHGESPDLILAWNVTFDYTYLHNRIPDFANKISPIKLGRYGEGDNIFYPSGISIVDYLSLYKKVHMREASYALDYIAQVKLKEKPWPKTNFGEINDLVKAKNINDVKRMVKLEEENQLLTYYDELRRLTKVKWEDLYFNSRIVEMLLLEEAKLKNIVLPNKKEITEKTDFQGATRESEVTGAYFGINKCDLTSAYPSMVTNFCLDTQNIDPGETDNNINIDGIYFNQNKDALLPSAVKKILILKDNLKKKKNIDKTSQQKYDAIKAVVNCFSLDTKIITPEGMKYVEDLKKGDIVYNVNKDTLRVEEDIVLETQRHYYRGELYHYKTRICDLKTTSEHRFLVRRGINSHKKNYKQKEEFVNILECYNTKNRRKFQIPKVKPLIIPSTFKYFSLFKEVQELNGEIWARPIDKKDVYKYRTKKILNFIKIRTTRNNFSTWYICKASEITEKELLELFKKGWKIFASIRPKTKLTPIFFDKKYFYSFLGWYISEGSLSKSSIKRYPNTTRGIGFRVIICQGFKNKLYREQIFNNLLKLGISIHNSSYKNEHISFSSELLYKFLERICGKKSRDKKIPGFLLKETTKNIKYFFKSLYNGDGTQRIKQYNTNSEQLANDILKLLIILGNNSVRIRIEKSHKIKYGNFYRVIWHNINKGISKEFITKEKYQGDVVCVTTKNGTIFAGRDNKFTLTGQSTFGVMGNRYFRLYDKNIASSITYLVRELIHYTKRRLKDEENIDVIYYDTDSVFTTIKDDITPKLNQYIKDWALTYGKKKIDLKYEYEGYFDSIFLLSKCHYYGYVHGKDKPEIKGVEIIRSSSSKYEAKFQQELLDKMLKKNSQENILDWIEIEKEKIKTFPIEEIGFPVKIRHNKKYKNIPIFVRAYELTKNINSKFYLNSGELFYYIFVKPFFRDDNVLAFKIDDKDFLDWPKHLDWDTIIRRNIIKKAETIFEAQGWDTTKLINPDQLGLF